MWSILLLLIYTEAFNLEYVKPSRYWYKVKPTNYYYNKCQVLQKYFLENKNDQELEDMYKDNMYMLLQAESNPNCTIDELISKININ